MSEQDLINLLATGYAQCKAVAIDNGATISALFLAGLAGSVTHCMGMCGPFVLSQVTSRLQDKPASTMTEMHRLSGAALVPYHLGRITTYSGLGGMAAVLSGGIMAFAGLKYLAAALLVFAALFFLGYALRGLKITVPGFSGSRPARIAGALGRLTRPMLDRPTGWRGYGLGLALGFLPCGLLYGALAAAASTGDALAGIFTMAAFALGTIPALLAVGVIGHIATARWSAIMSGVAPIILVANGGFLLFMAWQLIQTS